MSAVAMTVVPLATVAAATVAAVVMAVIVPAEAVVAEAVMAEAKLAADLALEVVVAAELVDATAAWHRWAESTGATRSRPQAWCIHLASEGRIRSPMM